MKVKVTWEFEADVSGFDPAWVDVPGLAKDLAKGELISLLLNGDITADDFEYSIVI